jgi:chitinase
VAKPVIWNTVVASSTPVQTPVPTPLPIYTPSPTPGVYTPSVQPTEYPTGPTDIIAIITKWANYYGVSAAWMIEVATCESTLNPAAINYGYSAGGGNPTGLFQFLPSTFVKNAVDAGMSGANIWSADDSAHVAAFMFSIGQSDQWQCQ